MTKSLIFDTETTDKTNPIIIEAAWLELDSMTPFAIGDSYVQRYNPGELISLGALATHHILDEELVDCPPSSSFSLPANVEYLIGHNVDFDWQAIGSPNVKRICTLALSRMLWPHLDCHSQGAMLFFLERSSAKELLKSSHDALADTGICSIVLQHICTKLEVETIEELWIKSEQARIPTVMPFGKHKGLILNNLPGDYKQWLLNKADIDPYLRQALA
jgi:exodeoxyribonuclease X